jgi:osmotically-inducible protein OsmY
MISGANAWQEPDNTKVNKQDKNQGAVTADKAGKVPADRDLMQQIRKAVVDDDTLSTNAHNVKIIAKNGKVTLKGPVKTAEEKANIEAKAVAVAGEGNVTNQITVKGAKADHDKN